MSGGAGITRTQAFADVSAVIAAMPQVFREEMLAALRDFEPRFLARMVAGVPVRHGPRPAGFRATGALRPSGGAASLLSTQIDVEDLRLSGGLLTPQAKALGFTAYILDHGRGMKNTRSRPRSRVLPGGDNSPLIGKWITVKGVRRKIGQHETIKYTRAISPISPDRYSITFGEVRYWARAEMDPLLLKIYDRALIRVAWNGVINA